MKGIPLYREINQIHAATHSGLRTSDGLFHCFRMSDIGADMKSLPPYRSDFFTVALNIASQHFNITINDAQFDNVQHSLVCVAPGQVSSFEKGGHWEGYCTFFKSEFVKYRSEISFLEEYPFFNIREINVFPLTNGQFENLSMNYRQIMYEQANPAPYHTDIVRSIFQAILWQIRRIYEGSNGAEKSKKAEDIIASKFQYLVNQQYLHLTLVEQYAEMLHITPNHLMQLVKKATGKTAKAIISERRIEEAKFLLKHTHDDVASIAYYLRFSEPTHFNKFFKKWSGSTPMAFRKAHEGRG